MEIIDAQIHEIDLPSSWTSGLTPELEVELGSDLAIASMDAVGVSGAVVSSDARHCLGYLARYPERFAGVPWVAWPECDPNFPVEKFIEEIGSVDGIVGVRLVLGIAGGSRIDILRAGGFERYFAAAEANGLAMFVTLHGFVSSIHETLRTHPDLTFVLDHLGLYAPPHVPTAINPFAELSEVLKLAEYENVAVKFTGVPSLSSQSFPFEDVWPKMHRYFEAFGVDRLMWGSDFTRCRKLHNYRESVDFLLHTDEVSQPEKEMLFSGSARRWLAWAPGGLLAP